MRATGLAGVLECVVVLAGCAATAEPGPEATRARATAVPERPAAMPRALRASFVRAVQREAGPAYDFASARGAGVLVAVSGAARFEVGPEGATVSPVARDGERAGFRATLGATRIGRGERLGALVQGALHASGNDARVERGPGVVERWVNGPLGLEHLLELATPPPGAGPLVVEVAVTGLAPRLVSREAVALCEADGTVRARYSELFVQDAAGREVASWLEVEAGAGAVRVVVDDARARYPLLIDPLIGLIQQSLEASDGAAGANFGRSVAIDGDTAVVGAPTQTTTAGVSAGAAYVFVRTGMVWAEQARLTASDAMAFDRFGWSVAVAGDTALVSAYDDDTPGGVNSGSAYVFLRTGTSWAEQAHLVASDAGSMDLFGYSVALAGDTALVGSRTDDTTRGTDAGSAYVFVRSGTAWSEQAKLEAPDGVMADNFGYSVAVEGNLAVIGAPWGDTTRGADRGAAYVFLRTGTLWAQEAKLEASDGLLVDTLGWSVALSGSRVIAGAPGDDTARGMNAGSAYVFLRTGTTWAREAKLEASDGAASDEFAFSVSLSGDVALVGASDADTALGANMGAAYVYRRSGATWPEQTKLTLGTSEALDAFARAVAVWGTTALVGAWLDDTARGADAGSATVFVLQAGRGDACASDGECESGHCADGVCCDTACGGGAVDCEACSVALGAAVDGTCGALSAAAAAAVTCRAAASACDVAETCVAGSTACPADVVGCADGGAASDGGGMAPDAGSATPDSGSATPDSGGVTPDAGSATLDSGGATPDSGGTMPGADAAARSDGGAGADSGATPTTPTDDGGCACRATRSRHADATLASVLGAALALALAERSRRRRRR